MQETRVNIFLNELSHSGEPVILLDFGQCFFEPEMADIIMAQLTKFAAC
jgi:Ser/Thr protein kinase RdoA (MazF antagonist)